MVLTDFKKRGVKEAYQDLESGSGSDNSDEAGRICLVYILIVSLGGHGLLLENFLVLFFFFHPLSEQPNIYTSSCTNLGLPRHFAGTLQSHLDRTPKTKQKLFDSEIIPH